VFTQKKQLRGAPMRPTLVVAAVLLLLCNGVAEPDPTRIAEAGGFLLGNAHRCGIETERVEHPEQ
jgi:hypothetical protein